MVSSAIAILIDDNFFNFFKNNLLFINRCQTKKLIGIVHRLQLQLGPVESCSVVDSMVIAFLYLNFLDLFGCGVLFGCRVSYLNLKSSSLIAIAL